MEMPTSSTADPPLPTPAEDAEARRTERGKTEARKSQAANEVGGRGGLDPTRYGDWEVNGLASDF
jgi:hypothetical protein